MENQIFFSLIVPVYNRPAELAELLESLAHQKDPGALEVVVVEDGSQQPSEQLVASFRDRLQLQYLKKPNTGPGDSRNFGMRHALGEYFILVDSDCVLPPGYFRQVRESLELDYADCYGGPDAAHPDFNSLQQAISFSMTSPWSTGGIRGGRKDQGNFQPRSFNMGLSRKAFEASGGFGNIHPGEDPDLSLRLAKQGFRIRYLPGAVVYHKRRISWRSFYRQVYKFGLARPILNRWHPGSGRPAYWFPTFFMLGMGASIILPFLLPGRLGFLPLVAFGCYLLIFTIAALRATGNPGIALKALLAVLIQFTGYGWGFLKSTILLTFSSKKPQALFPGLFFNP